MHQLNSLIGDGTDKHLAELKRKKQICYAQLDSIHHRQSIKFKEASELSRKLSSFQYPAYIQVAMQHNIKSLLEGIKTLDIQSSKIEQQLFEYGDEEEFIESAQESAQEAVIYASQSFLSTYMLRQNQDPD